MIAVDLKRPLKDEDPTELVITLDVSGLSTLLAQLEFLAQGRTDHIDLLSEKWGGNQLTGKMLTPESVPLHYVKVMLR